MTSCNITATAALVLGAAVLAGIGAPPALADSTQGASPPHPPAKGFWGGQGEAGIVVASGNTETRTANAKLALDIEDARWRHELKLEALYTSTDGVRTGRRWALSHQSNFSFSDAVFGFVSSRYENDAFGGFQFQAPLAAGIGYLVIDNDRTTVDVGGGIGIKIFKTRDIQCEAGAVIAKDACTSDSTPAADDVAFRAGARETQTIFTAGLNIDHALTETTTLFDHLKIELGAENTFVQNTIGVQIKISEQLALALSYDLRRNSDPPGNFQSTDAITTANLVYEFR